MNKWKLLNEGNGRFWLGGEERKKGHYDGDRRLNRSLTVIVLRYHLMWVPSTLATRNSIQGGVPVTQRPSEDKIVCAYV